ncbi:hypothetical protein AY555_10605 (plasmid) [Haematospirillum jordaniae]|uniref:SnoaL-like domain-containing protein n=2 Tax=Haematospirillum jordaniae TaxID=1549855 RepID=A0A145VQ42_9PROT|nr:hypothetical protein AY555_10605 [Haematospirillum jordaniae]
MIHTVIGDTQIRYGFVFPVLFGVEKTMSSGLLPTAVVGYIDAYNQKNVPAMLETLSDDIVFESVNGGIAGLSLAGKEAFTTLAEQSIRAFSVRSQSVRHAVVGHDAVALEVDYAAIVAADLPNGWKEGQRIDLRGVSFFELRHGLICRLTDFA